MKLLNEIKEGNLFKLCKVWGFVKYYHQSVASADLDWDEELFKIMPKVLSVEDDKKVDEIIYKWINSLGTLKQGEEIKSYGEVKLSPNTGWIKDTNFLSAELSDLLIRVEKSSILKKHHYIELTEEVENPKFKNEKQYKDMSYADDGCKLLSLFRYWNSIEHYFPNRHLIDENWDSALKQFIPKMVNEDTELGYTLNIYELVGKIQDGHGYVGSDGDVIESFWGNNRVPFEVDFVEEKVVVVKVLKDVSGLNIKVGDCILKLDNKNIKDIVKEKSKYFPSTSVKYKNINLKYVLFRTNNDSLELTIERDNSVIKERVTCSKDYSKIYKEVAKQPSHTLLNENVGYINPGYLATDEIHDIMKKFKNTKGLIVDLRYYPTDFLPYKLGNYLMPKETEFAKLCTVP